MSVSNETIRAEAQERAVLRLSPSGKVNIASQRLSKNKGLSAILVYQTTETMSRARAIFYWGLCMALFILYGGLLHV